MTKQDAERIVRFSALIKTLTEQRDILDEIPITSLAGVKLTFQCTNGYEEKIDSMQRLDKAIMQEFKDNTIASMNNQIALYTNKIKELTNEKV